jgi:hypothetical protein
MSAGVRIIKRNAVGLQSPSRDVDEKTGRQNDREIASTVKTWVADVAQRRRSERQIACTRFFAIN